MDEDINAPLQSSVVKYLSPTLINVTDILSTVIGISMVGLIVLVGNSASEEVINILELVLLLTCVGLVVTFLYYVSLTVVYMDSWKRVISYTFQKEKLVLFFLVFVSVGVLANLQIFNETVVRSIWSGSENMFITPLQDAYLVLFWFSTLTNKTAHFSILSSDRNTNRLSADDLSELSDEQINERLD